MLRKVLCFAIMAILTVCAFAEDGAVHTSDMYGRAIDLDTPATKVVALTAAECEIVCALGCEDALVGIGAYCDYPESISSLPVVNSGTETNVEQIVALSPEVVLMADMAQAKEQVEMLESLGIPVAVDQAYDIEGVYTEINMIGAILGKTAEADALVNDMKSTFESISAQSDNTGKTVYFEVSPLEWGLWTAGTGTFMDEIASMCGLTNIFADVEGWAEISEEQVIARNPDYIVTITMYYGEGQTPEEEIKSRNGWENIAAVQNGRVVNVDSNIFSRPGPRLKDAAIQLSEFVNADED